MAASQKELLSVRLDALWFAFRQGSRGHGSRRVYWARPPPPVTRNLTLWAKSTFTFQSMAMEDFENKHGTQFWWQTKLWNEHLLKLPTNWLHVNRGILTQLDWTLGTEEQTLTSLHVTICTYGSTRNFLVVTSLLQELRDQVELERISKLEYLMRTKEQRPTWTRVETT